MREKDKQLPGSPWGRVAGLLIGCLVTLFGVAARLDPHVILFRAGVGAFIVGFTVSALANVVRVTRSTRTRH